MQPDNKHKIFSKEELFKLIDEKRSLPPDADDFDKEAFEGLSMLKDRAKLDGLNNSIDEALRKEKIKARKKKNFYFLSAAAGLILIVGLFFILKNNSFEKKESVLAENTKAVENPVTVQSPKVLEESAPGEKERNDKSISEPAPTATGEASGKLSLSPPKEERKTESAVTTVNNNATGAGAMSGPPAQVPGYAQEKPENRKLGLNDADAGSDRSGEGKDYKNALAKEDQRKREEAKKSATQEEKLKEKDKTRYLTNTVWTSTPASEAGVSDESKNKSDDYRIKTQDSKNENSVAGNNANVPVQKNDEVAEYEKQTANMPEKRNKSNKPDTTVADMLAGYSYYDKKPDNGIMQGGEPQKNQQTSQPVQSQNAAAASPALSQKESADIPVEEKRAQEYSVAKGGKHEAQPETKVSAALDAESKSSLRGNENSGVAEFNGGSEALQKYVKTNLKISVPKKSGTIVAEFVVQKDGKIDTGSVRIISKIKDCDPCSKDVTEMVKTMPSWIPAMEKGKKVSRKEKITVPYNTDTAK